jgi:hypothetical protein
MLDQAIIALQKCEWMSVIELKLRIPPHTQQNAASTKKDAKA